MSIPVASTKSSDESTNNIDPRQLLRFYPVVCTLDFGFWRQVNSAKLFKWRLDTPTVPITGSLVPLSPVSAPSPLASSIATDASSPSLHSSDRRNETSFSLGWRLHLEKDAFQSSLQRTRLLDDHHSLTSSIHSEPTSLCDEEAPVGTPATLLLQSFPVRGIFFNANSADDFRKLRRQQFIHQITAPILQNLIDCSRALISKTPPSQPPCLLQCTSASCNLISQLTPFLIFSYADLKLHLFYYNVALPTFRPTVDIAARVFPSHSLSSSCSTRLPFGLSYSSLASVGESLLSTNSTRSPGLCGACVLIRRKISGADACVENNDWLASFLNDQQSQRIDEDTVIVSLWNLLRKLHHCRDSATETSCLSSNFSIDTLLAEGIVCLVDAVRGEGDALGWPLRSTLFALGYLGLAGKKLRLLAFRDCASGVQHLRLMKTNNNSSGSQMLVYSIGMIVDLPPAECFAIKEGYKEFEPTDASPTTLFDAVSPGRVREDSQRSLVVPGWLRHTLQQTHQHHSSSATFLVDLRRHMNPIASQADAVYLNIRLIQWRLLPSLDASRLQNLRFLFLGVGTLGCNILRILVAWGVTQFTLVDSGRVALSSPARQSLFLHEDAVWNNGRGRLKVIAAKKRLLEIRPDLSINAVPMDIPMPGHSRYLSTFDSNEQFNISSQEDHRENIVSPTSSTSPFSTKKNPVQSAHHDFPSLHHVVDLLERLIDAHDVVLLLTDSRESRWLPSMLVSTRPFRGNSNLIPSGLAAGALPSSGSPRCITKSSRFKPPPEFSPLSLSESSVDHLTTCTPNQDKNVPSSAPDVSHHGLTADSSFSPHCLHENQPNRPSESQECWSRLFSSYPIFKSPLCITVALGFDTFVVMRHGQRKLSSSRSPSLTSVSNFPLLEESTAIRSTTISTPPLTSDTSASPLVACYFCNDLTAPADSLARRPLDQQCTVTRPGISGLASSVASELIASISQHPQVPDPPHSAADFGSNDTSHSCLGATPHCVRGSLGDFRLVCTETEAFDHCISCSIPIAEKFCSSQRLQFIAEAIARSEILEEVSGLSAMKKCQREDEVLAFDILEQ